MFNYWPCKHFQQLTYEQLQNIQRSSKVLAEFTELYPETPVLLPDIITSETIDHLQQLLLMSDYDDVLACYESLKNYRLSDLQAMMTAADYLAAASSMSLIEIAVRTHTDQQFRDHVDFIRSDKAILKERILREFRKNCFLHGDINGLDSLAIILTPSDALRKTQPLDTHLVFQRVFSAPSPFSQCCSCGDFKSRLTKLSDGYLNLVLDTDFDPVGKFVLAGGSIVRALGFFESHDSDFDLYFCGFSSREQAMACLKKAILLLMSCWHIRNHKDCSIENISSHPVLMTSRHAVTVDLPIPTSDWSEASHVKIQFITRLFANEEEVTLDFDQDICCATYDGSDLRVLPRFLRAASSRQCIVESNNHWRLVKYHARGFDQLVTPGFKPHAPSTSFFSGYDLKSTHDCVLQPSLLNDNTFRMRFDDKTFPYILWTESVKSVPEDIVQIVWERWMDRPSRPKAEWMQHAVFPQSHLFFGRTPKAILALDIVFELPRSKIIFIDDFSSEDAVSLAVEISDPRIVGFVQDVSTHVLQEMCQCYRRPFDHTAAMFYRAILSGKLHYTAKDLSRYSPLLRIKVPKCAVDTSKLSDAYEVEAELRPYLWLRNQIFGLSWRATTHTLFKRPTEIIDFI